MTKYKYIGVHLRDKILDMNCIVVGAYNTFTKPLYLLKYEKEDVSLHDGTWPKCDVGVPTLEPKANIYKWAFLDAQDVICNYSITNVTPYDTEDFEAVAAI